MVRSLSSQNDERRNILKNDGIDYHRTSEGKLFSIRYRIGLLAFLGFALLFSMRVTLSIAIVDMVVEHRTQDDSHSQNCPLPQNSNSSLEKMSQEGSFSIFLNVGKFDWTISQQANLLSAFFYGYALTQLPGGYIASKNNGKNLFGWAILIRALLLALNPFVAYFGGVQLLYVFRALEGATEGITLPTFQYLAGRWAPECERSFFSSFVISGVSIGMMLA
ncbi:sialin-like [Convolutriloba macropyga]|uniref:sialin-like n=1 Tax=Convolutriloba macropyga TaxID=536237 RepID=UPI003F522CA5